MASSYCEYELLTQFLAPTTPGQNKPQKWEGCGMDYEWPIANNNTKNNNIQTALQCIRVGYAELTHCQFSLSIMHFITDSERQFNHVRAVIHLQHNYVLGSNSTGASQLYQLLEDQITRWSV